MATFWRELDGVNVDRLFDNGDDDNDDGSGGEPAQAHSDDNDCPVCGKALHGEPDQDAHVNRCLDGDGGADGGSKGSTTTAAAQEAFLKAFRRPGNADSEYGEQPMKRQRTAATPAALNRSSSAGSSSGSGSSIFASQRPCPFYKRMPGTRFTVDAFRYGVVSDCDAYFLTHFHSDHYGGLTKAFKHGLIYCSVATANLVCLRLGVRKEFIRPLCMNTTYIVSGVRVTLLDANHCPGAALILFELPDGRIYLHTGDFRACADMLEHPCVQPFVPPEPPQFTFPVPLTRPGMSAADQDALFNTPVRPPPNSRLARQGVLAQMASGMARWMGLSQQQPKPTTATAEAVVSTDDVADAGNMDVDDDGSEQEDEVDDAPPDARAGLDTSLPFSDASANSTDIAPPAARPLSSRLSVVYLDTTYCKPHHCFPTQTDVLAFLRAKVRAELARNPCTLIAVGTYSIGKEKVALAIADELNCLIFVEPSKRRILRCLQDERLNRLLTDDPFATCLHLRPLGATHPPAMKQYLARFASRWTHALAFRPTGWTHTRNSTSLAAIRPSVSGNISVYGVPYSEHSSFEELRAFISALQPQRIIATVNVGSERYRNEMQQHFSAWLRPR